MKRYVFALIGSLALIAGAGCSKQEEALPSSTPIEVELKIEPQEVAVNEAATFTITVTQDGKAVDDAKEAEFEIWKEGQEQHETIPAVHQQDGVYTAQKAFSEPGTYNVMYHVTARDFHNMQKHSFSVKGPDGEADGSAAAGHAHEPAAQPDSNVGHEHGDTHQHGSSETGEHHHGPSVDMHFQPADVIKANTAAALTVHLVQNNQPLTDAKVRFEYWLAEGDKHEFVDARETKAGEYTANSAIFPASGSYTVKVHVEKGDIHDHREYPVSVQ